MSNQAELSVGTAVQDGWSAFRLAPWAFVGFVLLSSLLAQLANLIPLLGALLATLVNLWGGVGLIRGSWIALGGTAPRFDDFTRWNGAALWRLFSRQLVLALPLSLFSSAVLLLAATTVDARELVQSLYFQLLIADPSSSEASTALITQMQGLAITILSDPIALMVTISGIIVVVYVHVNQAFLGFLAVVQGLGPISTIREGFRTVRSDWWQVLGLLVLQTLILLLGVMACGFGLLAAIPVVACSTASAYRQLFSAGAETGD